MVKSGDSISNGRGHRILFIKTASDTNGELLEFEEFLLPNDLGEPEHVHLQQSEHLEVISGKMTAKIGDRKQVLSSGEEDTISPGTRHRWWNDSNEELHVRTEIRPALHFERLLKRSFAIMAKQGAQ